MRRILVMIVAGLLGLIGSRTAFAQLAPEIGYVLPAGVRAGTTTEVTIGGYDWTPDMQLFAHDPRITWELIGPPTPVLITEPPYWFGAKGRGYAWPLAREFKARVTVPADVPPGLIKWQAANANGVSPVGILHVSDLPEVLEEPKRDGPQVIPSLPVVVSGQIRRIEEIDRYKIHPSKSGPVTIELFARRLTAPANPMCLHGMLKVHDQSGRKIVDVAATEGLDLTTTFAVQADQDYVISLHDVDYAGDRSYVYRLTMTQGPGLMAAYPASGKRGETRPVESVGYGLATGAAQLESVVQNVSFPADPVANSFTYALESPFGKSKPIPLGLSDLVELVEGATLPELPWAITGLLDVRFGSDCYSVPMKKGDIWQLSAETRTESLPLDLDLTIINGEGKEIASNDDSHGSTNPEIVFHVPLDGIYRIVVSDRSGHSGNRGACYRLVLEKPREQFALNFPDLVAVPLGGQTKIPVTVARRGGFKGAIGIQLDGLPAGVTVPANLEIPAEKSDLTIEVTCAADAAASASLVKVETSATINGNAVTQPLKSLVLAAIMKPRIKITPEGLDDVRKIHRGSTHPFPLLIDRLEGFAGEIFLEMTAKQQRHRQGLSGDELIVPAAANRFDYPIFVPEWMETTKTSRMILNGAVKVADPKGNVRTLLQKMEMRLGILPEGALMKVAHAPAEYRATAGGELVIPLVISRVAEFHEPVKVELVPNADQAGLVSAETKTLSETDTKCFMTIKLQPDKKLVGEQQFLIRVTGMQHGNLLVKSETTVPVDVRPE